MKGRWIKLIAGSILWGIVVYGILYALWETAWLLYPYPAGADEDRLREVWAWHAVAEKFSSQWVTTILPLVIVCRTVRKAGLGSIPLSVLSAVTYVASGCVVFVTRFSWSQYVETARPGPLFVMLLVTALPVSIASWFVLSRGDEPHLYWRKGLVPELAGVPSDVRRKLYWRVFWKALRSKAMAWMLMWVMLSEIGCAALAFGLDAYARGESFGEYFGGPVMPMDRIYWWLFLLPFMIPLVLLGTHDMYRIMRPHLREFLAAGL